MAQYRLSPTADHLQFRIDVGVGEAGAALARPGDTAPDGDRPVLVHTVGARPDLDLNRFEHTEEVDLYLTSGAVIVESGVPSDSCRRLPVGIGLHRMLIAHEVGEQLTYQVWIWPIDRSDHARLRAPQVAELPEKLPPVNGVRLIVAKEAELDVSRSWYEPVRLAQGYVCVPYLEPEQMTMAGLSLHLSGDLRDKLLDDLSLTFALECAIVGVSAEASHHQLASLWTYGSDQTAAVWSENGLELYRQEIGQGNRRNWPNNLVLREIGVHVGGALDECDALGLYEVWRQTEWQHGVVPGGSTIAGPPGSPDDHV